MLPTRKKLKVLIIFWKPSFRARINRQKVTWSEHGVCLLAELLLLQERKCPQNVFVLCFLGKSLSFRIKRVKTGNRSHDPKRVKTTSLCFFTWNEVWGTGQQSSIKSHHKWLPLVNVTCYLEQMGAKRDSNHCFNSLIFTTAKNNGWEAQPFVMRKLLECRNFRNKHCVEGLNWATEQILSSFQTDLGVRWATWEWSVDGRINGIDGACYFHWHSSWIYGCILFSRNIRNWSGKFLINRRRSVWLGH